MRRFALAACIVAAACGQPAKTTAPQRTAVNIPSNVGRAKVSEVIAPAPRFVDHAILGAELGKDGMVEKQSYKFTAGQPIYLTLVLLQSPPGLQTSAVWTDVDKKPLYIERHEMNGKKVVTFAFRDPKIKPGHYRVTAYWGGNIATEEEFDITAVSQKAKGKRG